MTMITKTDAEVLIPEGEVREIYKTVAQESIALKLLTRLPNMSSNKTRIKVENSLPLVYWQASDTARKKLTKMDWKNKYIYAEELAVIIPIAEATLDDAEYDIWGEIKPKIAEAIAQKIDSTILLGDEKPANFPDGILKLATDRGFTTTQGSKTFYTTLSDLMGEVEESGFDVTAIIGGSSLKKDFRNMLDTTGQLIVGDEISSLPRYIVKNGAWDKTKARAIVGDFKQGVYSIRQDIKYKLLTEGVIQNPDDGSILYNLGQDDMVALRVTFRMGWQIPNPINPEAPEEDKRLPFAALLPNA